MVERKNAKKMFCCGSIITVSAAIIGILVILQHTNSVVSDQAAPSTLEFVIVVSRHGARSPAFPYTNDPYVWPDGKGMLTIKGKQQMFDVGRTLRNRYGWLFNHTYNEKEIFVRSTKTVRTYMSAATLLAGMFPPQGHRIWNSDLNWQPIPIWQDEFDRSSQIFNNNTNCPKFSALQQEISKSVGYFNTEENKELYAYLTQHTGFQVLDHFYFTSVWDSISCMAENSIPIPSWANPVYEKMTRVSTNIFKTLAVGSPAMTRFVSGTLLKDFDSWITRKIEKKVGEKMLIHVGHDFSIMGLMSVVGINETARAYPSASLIFEIHRSPVFQHEVKMIYYNNSETKDPAILNMPACQEPCTLNSFMTLLRHFEIDEKDWHSECKL